MLIYLHNKDEAKALRYPQRVIAAIKIDAYLQVLKNIYQSATEPYREYLRFKMSQATLSRFYLTDDENSCVGYIHEGKLYLWCESIEAGKQQAAREYVASEMGVLE